MNELCLNPNLIIRNDKALTVILDDLPSLSIGRSCRVFTLVSAVEFKILQDIWLYSDLLLGQIVSDPSVCQWSDKNPQPAGVQVITAEQSQQGRKRSRATGMVHNHGCSMPQVYCCTLQIGALRGAIIR